jgi:bifunctional DNase/RNase
MKITPFQAILAVTALALGIGLVSIEVSNFLNTSGYAKVDIIEVDGNMLTVGSDCMAVTADTSEERADSIRLGLAKRIDERPNTHDVFVDAFETFNITIDSVTLDNFDGKYYYSNIILSNGRTVLKIDSRPSDAIAIALRADAPIYINKTLLLEYGEKVCEK